MWLDIYRDFSDLSPKEQLKFFAAIKEDLFPEFYYSRVPESFLKSPFIRGLFVVPFIRIKFFWYVLFKGLVIT